MKKIMFIGHGQHGKDTAAEMLRDNHGYRLLPASWTFADEFMRGYMGYTSTSDCYADRVNYRDLWGEKIAAYNTPDPAALCKRVLRESDLYVGCRRIREFNACKDLFDHIVWVDRSLHLPEEPYTSMQLQYTDADVFLDNNSGLDDLEKRVAELAERLK